MLGTTSSTDERHIDVIYIRVFNELLKHYETDRNLHAATEYVHNLRQKHEQKDQKYYERLIQKANRLRSAFAPRDLPSFVELTTRFSRPLRRGTTMKIPSSRTRMSYRTISSWGKSSANWPCLPIPYDVMRPLRRRETGNATIGTTTDQLYPMFTRARKNPGREQWGPSRPTPSIQQPRILALSQS